MRLQEAADQCFVLLHRHAYLLLIANSRFSSTGRQHEHDATQRALAHRAQAYSPKCVEGVSLFKKWLSARSALQESPKTSPKRPGPTAAAHPGSRDSAYGAQREDHPGKRGRPLPPDIRR